MKGFNGLFGKEFTLKMVNQISSSSHYVKDVKLQSLPADYDEPVEKFYLDRPAKKRKYLSSRVKTIDGTIYRNGRHYYIGDHDYRLGIYKSRGGLVVLPVYSLESDDYFYGYLPNMEGFVILNKDLEIVYKNFDVTYEDFFKKKNLYDFLHDYGPTALLFLEPKDFDIRTQDDLRRVYNLRQQTLIDNGMDSAKIAEDEVLFNKAFDILKEEYKEIQENNQENKEINAGK